MLQRMGGRGPLVVAHRGGAALAPENTLAAFEKAIAVGADMVELDVRMTKDFFLVAHHDQSVRRTTNGRGNIWDLTLEELRMLDAGSWFSKEFAGTRIPTLRQVMELLLPTSVVLNMEVKTDGDPRKRIALEEACILAILEKKFEERVLVSSFDHAFLKRMHHLYPSIRTGALYVPVRDMTKKPSSFKRKLGVSTFICSRSQLQKRFVEDAHSGNISVACYTVNTREDVHTMVRLGVDAIVTDHPGRVLGWLAR